MIPALTGTAEDTTLDTLIARADAVLASWCGFPAASASVDPTLEATAFTEYYHAPSPREPRLLRLRVRPVTTLTSVHWDSAYDASYSTEVVSGDRTLDGVEGTIWLHPDATSISAWPKQYRGIKVVYTAGYNTGADARITQAIAALVSHWWAMRRHLGVEGFSNEDGGMSVTSPAGIPDHVKILIAPVVLPEVGLG